ncbi:hypothetical protein [Halovulum sp. GXIMD14793]
MFKHLIAIVLMTFATGAAAGPAAEAIFAEGILTDLPDNTVVHYIHTRSGPEQDNFLPIREGAVTLTLAARDGQQRVVELTMTADGRKRVLDDSPASAGNPVVMAFMESTLRSMSAITGGSPFYIRNRLRDTLRSGGEVQAVTIDHDGRSIATQEIILHPFKADPNAARMGVFADLELRFVVSEDVPGYFLTFAAQTPKGGPGLCRDHHVEGGELMRRLTLALILAAAPVAAQDYNDYPTLARADYVFGCMAVNGQTRTALQSCSCSIDVIASILPYEKYVAAEAVLQLRQNGGERYMLFRSVPANASVAELRRAQAEAEILCF